MSQTINGMPVVTPSKIQRDHWTPGIPTHIHRTLQQATVLARQSDIDRKRAKMDLPAFYPILVQVDLMVDGVQKLIDVTYDCPTLAGTKAKDRLLVIAPDGTEVWVDWKHVR